jgi:hypothetical protein
MAALDAVADELFTDYYAERFDAISDECDVPADFDSAAFSFDPYVA